MKVILDLNKSFNHYYWEDKEELKEYIESMLDVLWKYYRDNIQDDNDPNDEIYVKFYDILDMFNSFTIENKESDK